MVVSLPQPSGKILPENFRRKRWALCRAMDPALTADQMEHKNARMHYAHYQEVLKDSDDIIDYWTAFPSDGGKVARFVA
jgi:hypothetical protein